jgi:hypothetical protein
MFPFNDFNFVFGGFATIAATVGYTCVKNRVSRYRSESPSRPTKDEVEAQRPTIIRAQSLDNITYSMDATKPRSLKRKFTEDEDNIIAGYPYNLSSIYPNKRSRTPTSESESDESPQTPEPTAPLIPLVLKQENSPITIDRPEGVIEVPAVEIQHTPSVVVDLDFKPTLPPSAPATDVPAHFPLDQKSPETPLPVRGFAAFAGTSSPFASANKVNTSTCVEKPIWCQDNNKERVLDESTTADVFSAKVVEDTAESEPEGTQVVPLNALEAEAHSKSTYIHLTGEEEEEIVSELKGAKIYVKRGNKDFTDGMLGHIKFLSSQKTQSARLLFRREPLWSVSMNVRLAPTVRCTYNAEDGVLRVIHKEPIEPGDNVPTKASHQLVIYAIKRGRIPRTEFQAFAETVVASSHLKP